MRRLLKKNSTKAERIFYEILKELKIPFKHRWIIGGREIDFVIGKYAVEIDGHRQNPNKNTRLVELGYIPIHYNNQEIINDKQIIKQTWRERIFSTNEQIQTETQSM